MKNQMKTMAAILLAVSVLAGCASSGGGYSGYPSGGGSGSSGHSH